MILFADTTTITVLRTVTPKGNEARHCGRGDHGQTGIEIKFECTELVFEIAKRTFI